MKKGDKILFILLLSIGILGCVAFMLLSKDASYITVTANEVTIGTYPLHTDREIRIETENGGENVLQILDGCVKMISANCPNLDCVHHKEISLHHESIICLPHKVVVTIYAPEDEGDIDVIIQ